MPFFSFLHIILFLCYRPNAELPAKGGATVTIHRILSCRLSHNCLKKKAKSVPSKETYKKGIFSIIILYF